VSPKATNCQPIGLRDSHTLAFWNGERTDTGEKRPRGRGAPKQFLPPRNCSKLQCGVYRSKVNGRLNFSH
jgi:hypothetical protein